MDHPRPIHSEPTNVRDYMSNPGHYRPASACTNRTMPRADPRSDGDRQRSGGDSAIEPPRSIQLKQELPSQP
jgi:hypothetical protein